VPTASFMVRDTVEPTLATAWLAAIIDSSDDAIISKDLNGVITTWNAGAEAIFGYRPAEAIGRSVTMLIPEDRLDEEPGILARIRKGERIRHYETVRRHKSGRLINISLTVSPILGEDGSVIGASKIARDITQRMSNQLEIEKLAAIVDSSSDAIITKDLDGVITSWNSGAQAIFGYMADEAIGRPVTMLIPDDRIDEEPGILSRVRNGDAVDHYETIRRRKDGRLIDISLNVSPIRDANGKVIGASKIARDITEHKRLAAAERESEMMHRLVETQESERHRIARNLHDHIGQEMTALRLKVDRIAAMLDGEHPALEELESVRTLAEKMDMDVGFLSWEMRPTELGFLGLADALSSFTSEWSRQYGIEADFHAVPTSIKGDLPKEVETNLYRILQEALNNILKHAGATRVNVIFHRANTGITLMVEDDGKGFNPDVALRGPGAHHLGVIGMRERAELLNGSFEIESVIGKGTTVVCRIPIDHSRKASTTK
jgi:PAS domain S-box-containing protein